MHAEPAVAAQKMAAASSKRKHLSPAACGGSDGARGGADTRPAPALILVQARPNRNPAASWAWAGSLPDEPGGASQPLRAGRKLNGVAGKTLDGLELLGRRRRHHLRLGRG